MTAKQVRLRRGTSAQHATFAGADGEITIDTTLRQIRVHDGLTPGGFLMLQNGSAAFFTTLLATTALTVAVNTANAAVRITQTGTGNALLVEDSANPDATPFVIDQNGRVVLGHTVQIDPVGGVASGFGAHSTAAQGNHIAGFRWSADNAPPFFSLAKSRGATAGSHVAVVGGDALGGYLFTGSDGTNFIQAARVDVLAEGTISTGVVPGRLVISTANSAGSLVEAFRVNSSQNVGIGAGIDQPDVALEIRKGILGASGLAARNTTAIPSNVTNTYISFQSIPSTQADTFTLPNLLHFAANQQTFGAGSVVTTQEGFRAGTNLIGAANNFGFRGLIPAGTGRYNLYIDGTAENFMQGNLGLGTLPIPGSSLNVSANITGTTNARLVRNVSTILSDVTASAYTYLSNLSTQAATFTLPDLRHFQVTQGTFGAGSTVTTQVGYSVESNMIGAVNNYGFRGSIPSGTGRYNLYMEGTADNFLNGSLALGGANSAGVAFSVNLNATGATTANSALVTSTVLSDVTSAYNAFRTATSTQATTFALNELRHFYAVQGTFGAGSTVSNQYAFRAAANLIGAVSNFGFLGDIPAGTGRWNNFQSGTACNLYNGYSFFNKQIFQYAPAPAAQDTSATLSSAQIQASIITSNPAAAITLTLPTGTTLETVTAGSNAWQTNTSLEVTFINTNATNAVSIAANTGATIVGNTTVAANTSTTFRIRKTAANTFVAYRM